MQKFYFSLYLGEKSPKLRQFVFLLFFKKMFLFYLLKTVWMKNYYDTWLSIPDSLSGKILGLKLSSKILLTDQIATDLKKSRGIKLIFFVCKSQINWAWSGLARHGQINSKLYIRNMFKRQIWSIFLHILNHHIQRVLWNYCRLLVCHCFGQSVQYFSQDFLISFIPIFLTKF